MPNAATAVEPGPGSGHPVAVYIRTRSSPGEYRAVRADRRLAYEYLPTDDEDWQRALQVQAALAEAGPWRGVGMGDLVISAVAERSRVTVLHYDGDFDSVAAVTGQPTQWVVPAGSVP